MKRLTFLIMILLVAFISEAQPTVDMNWKTDTLFFEDNFYPPRSNWSYNHWMDSLQDNKWKAHLAGCVTHGESERQVYQKENAIFNSIDNSIKLKAINAGERIDINDYSVPLNMVKNPDDSLLYYKSGAICIGQTGKQQALYGFFEIRCRLPVNRGAFPAFWLFDNSNNNYREIDVFEYSWAITDREGILGSSRYFEGQIYFYNGSNRPENRDSYTFGRYGYNVPTSSPDLSNWHVYGMEWSPGFVKWFFDNKLVGCYSGSSVPALPMYIIVNNAVDSYSTPNGIPIVGGFPDSLTIDYVKIYNLKKDKCGLNKSILSQNDLTTFDYCVYNNISIGSIDNYISVPENQKIVLRASNSIIINKNFSVPVSSTLELITHSCP